MTLHGRHSIPGTARLAKIQPAGHDAGTPPYAFNGSLIPDICQIVGLRKMQHKLWIVFRAPHAVYQHHTLATTFAFSLEASSNSPALTHDARGSSCHTATVSFIVTLPVSHAGLTFCISIGMHLGFSPSSPLVS